MAYNNQMQSRQPMQSIHSNLIYSKYLLHLFIFIQHPYHKGHHVCEVWILLLSRIIHILLYRALLYTAGLTPMYI